MESIRQLYQRMLNNPMTKMDFDAISYGYNKVQRWAFKFFQTFYLMTQDYDMNNGALCCDMFFEAGDGMKSCFEQKHSLEGEFFTGT